MRLTSRTRRQGLRHEGLFCALFVFFGKLAAGVALAGSNVMLEIAGFNVEVDGTDQPDHLTRTQLFTPRTHRLSLHAS